MNIIISENQVHPSLNDFQREAVISFLAHGKFFRAIEIGMGLQITQLEILRQVLLHKQKPILYIIPKHLEKLIQEIGKRIGLNVTPYDEKTNISISGVYICNKWKLRSVAKKRKASSLPQLINFFYGFN